MTKINLCGVIPPVTTPFDAHGEIEYTSVKAQVDWLVDCGVSGIAVGGSTGEGHTLEADEFRTLINVAFEAADGRIDVIAGIITDSTRESVRRGQMIQDSGVAALQVTPVHYVFKPGDDDTVEHFRTLSSETKIPIIIYNVIPWNYLSPELLCRVMREVPGVIGVKQSAGDMKLFADLMISADPDDLIFTAWVPGDLLQLFFPRRLAQASSSGTQSKPETMQQHWTCTKSCWPCGMQSLVTIYRQQPSIHRFFRVFPQGYLVSQCLCLENPSKLSFATH